MALLPLESFRQLVGWHPWHFWGLAGELAPVTSKCNDVVRQYAWQNSDAAGRAEILEATSRAEERLRDYLGFSVAPHYVEETLPYSNPLLLNEGRVRALGVERLTEIDAAAPVTYSDLDNDGLAETFAVTVATAVTDPDQIAVYFAAGDRWDSSEVSDRWRVQPVKVVISGGMAIISGHAWQLTRPVLHEGVETEPLDPSTSANFVTTLAVYQRDTDPADAVTIHWIDENCASLSERSIAARTAIRDGALGILVTAQDGRACPPVAPQARVTVRYLAGQPLEQGQMARKWQQIVARMAMAEMGRPICACDEANRQLYYWQYDLARAAGSREEQYQIGDVDLNNPFGTARGHIYAWREVRNLRQVRGMAF
jgi:hypothetical protein